MRVDLNAQSIRSGIENLRMMFSRRPRVEASENETRSPTTSNEWDSASSRTENESPEDRSFFRGFLERLAGANEADHATETYTARRGVQEFELSLDDLSRRIQDLERITEKWREAGSRFDTTR